MIKVLKQWIAACLVLVRRKNGLHSFSLCCLILVLVGCDTLQLDHSLHKYQKEQLSFQHFGHWDVATDEQVEGVRFFTLEGPSDIVITGQVYAQQESVLMDDYVRWYSEQFAQELPFGKVIDIRYFELEKTVGEVVHSGVREDFVIELLGQHLPFSREYLMLEQNDKVLYLMYQSEQSDHKKGTDALDLLLKTVKF